MCRRTLFLSSNVAVANWPTLRLQCHRRKDFWKDLFKRASSESLLLVCLIYFLAWFYSWKIECDVSAACILLLKKVRKRETVRYFKHIRELPFSQNSPTKLSLQRQSIVLELKFGMQVPPFWHGDEEHGDWKRGNDRWDHPVNAWTVLAIGVNMHTSSRASTFGCIHL